MINGATARIERSRFVKNTQRGQPSVENNINPLYGGGGIVYSELRLLIGSLPPLVVADSSFIKNEALGPGGAILVYSDDEGALPDLEGRVRFVRNVSEQNMTVNDIAVVTDSF